MPSNHTLKMDATSVRPVERLQGFRTLKPLRTRGLPKEFLAIREGKAGFRRLCSLRLAPTDDSPAGTALADEAAILARLHHPAILPVFDCLEVDAWRILVLAFEGLFTIDRIASAIRKQPGRLHLQGSLFLAHCLFDALAHAHGKLDQHGLPLVHGDVHPANVVVCRNGHVLIRGFRGSLPSATGAEAQLDDSPYAAPELESSPSASPRSDLYGAAAIVWELLTGHPFSSDMDRTIPPLATTRPELPTEISNLLDTCLSPDPTNRLVHAATITDTLERTVDLKEGRDHWKRLHARVLRRIPTSARALSAGTLPPQTRLVSSTPTKRFHRGGMSHAPAVLLAGHPARSPLRIERPALNQRTVSLTEAHSYALEATMFDDPMPRTGVGFDDEAPTLPARNPIPSESKKLAGELVDVEALSDDDDTIVQDRGVTIQPSCCERWGKIVTSPPREAYPSRPPGTDPSALRIQPQSFPPVATDQELPKRFTEPNDVSLQTVALVLALTIVLAPGAWFAGRYAMGPLWSTFSTSPTEPPTLQSPSRRAVPIGATLVEFQRSPIPQPSHDNDPISPGASIPIHQSLLFVEGPPDGFVYINGIRTGKTGEAMVTRSCGLRHVRVGTEGKAHGVEWLSKGQSVRLPCGKSTKIREPSNP